MAKAQTSRDDSIRSWRADPSGGMPVPDISYQFAARERREQQYRLPVTGCRSTVSMGLCEPQMSVIVKICGITNRDDALASAELGANALGFVFHDSSPRSVSLEVAANITESLPPSVVKVGVFVDALEEKVMRAIAACGLNVLQFHGTESPDYCLQFGLMSVKAFRIRDESFLTDLERYPTDAWLLDSYVAGQPGGTGATFNWDLAAKAGALGKPIFLAGGLTPENVAVAVRQVRPYAVDVSSGVEAAPGKKDLEKVKAFIQTAKNA
jgi:phosphoribosylanthranilate isomerase